MRDDVLIEKFGHACEEEGLPRIAGKLIGFLMLNEGPFTLDELAERLLISKTSASTNTRLLERLGIVEHSTRPGDRHDYYDLAADHAERMFAMAQRRLHRFYGLICAAAEALPQAEESQRARLTELQRFYEFLVVDMEERLEKWRSIRLLK